VHPASPTAKEALLRLVRRDPRQWGYDRTRWRLADLLAECSGWQVETSSGMAGILRRLGISYQRGRHYVHSPDPDYADKMTYIQALLAQSRACTERLVALYLDEFTYYRQPTLAAAWEARNEAQPRARRSHRADTPTRVIATLDPWNGRVVAWQGSRVGIPQLVRFYQQVREAYPEAERFHIILDNWPVHFHPEVLVALEPQASPWPRYLPRHWPTEPSPAARKRWGGLHLPLQLVPLPTYASWENPIEKLWRLGRQEVLHLHRLADRLDDLRRRFLGFLQSFECGSQALLHYVGLVTHG
jgi:transposase